jgi:hypothetical protein
MDLVSGAEVLLRYGEPGFGRTIARQDATAMLVDLHTTVTALHAQGVVIGDFNDLNVLVRGTDAFVIDADSFQFGPFLCRVYTDRFLDPTLCAPSATVMSLDRPYTFQSDWYSFAAIALQTLIFVGPWGGMHKPKDVAKRVPQGRRALERVSLFDPEVQAPKPALPLSVLSDELLHAFEQIFVRDDRTIVPRGALESLRWRCCSLCGKPYARNACPACVTVAAIAATPPVVTRGEVVSRLLFSTRGAVIAATSDRGVVRWIAHHEGRFTREDGRTILEGALDSGLFFALDGDATIVARRGRTLELSPTSAPQALSIDMLGTRPMIAFNEQSRYYVRAGTLYRAARYGTTQGSLSQAEERIGDVLEGQTLFWVGPTFGVGFYRAGGLSVAFVFDAARGGLDDTVKLPRWTGQLVSATAVVDAARAWLFVSIEESGKTVNRCVVLSRHGAIEANHEALSGDGSWLGTLGGKCCVQGMLLCPTDAGIVRVEVRGGRVDVTRQFPDTEVFVSAESALFLGEGGVVAADAQEIKVLKIA